jgi:hypothetical protein
MSLPPTSKLTANVPFSSATIAEVGEGAHLAVDAPSLAIEADE